MIHATFCWVGLLFSPQFVCLSMFVNSTTQTSSLTNEPARRATSRQTAKFSNCRVTITTPIWGGGLYVVLFVTLDIALCIRNLTILVSVIPQLCLGPWNLKWITWRDHAHFRASLWCVGHTKSEMSMITYNKDMKSNAKCKIFVLSHPLGNEEVTHGVHLLLDGKCMVDFLLVTIELFR